MYLKAKIDELEINSKIKSIGYLYGGISFFKKGYQPRNKIVKDENHDLLADYSHRFSASWRKRFSQLLNVQEVNDVTQTEIHTAEPLVHDPSTLEVEIAIEKLKRDKSPGIDQIPVELIKAGRRKIRSEINKCILFGIRRNGLTGGRSRSLYLFIGREVKQIVVIKAAYHFGLLRTEFYPTSCYQG